MSRKLCEQWVEEIDGVEHMVKLVEGDVNRANRCDGCTFHNEYKKLCELPGGVKHVSDVGCARRFLIIKDLGPVNEDGFLRDERSGQYPDIRHDKRNGVYEAYLHATLINPAMSAVLVRVQASSMDRLKDAWNRRA